MDFKSKGMTWVGNVYQKFEAMCLEVEDIMCQETAKYVETQVQSVGVSVKKFYAEVVQDLLPPSSAEPTKNDGSTLSLEQTADFGTCKKPKVATKEEWAKDSPSIHDPSFADKGTSQEQNDEVGIKKGSKAGIEAYSVKEKLPPFEMSEVITLAGKDPSQALLSHSPPEKSHLPPSAVNPVTVVGSFKQDENVVCTEESSIRENSPLAVGSIFFAPVGEGENRDSSISRLGNVNHGNECNTPAAVMSPTSREHAIFKSPRKTGTTSNNSINVVRVSDSCATFSASSRVHPAVSNVCKVVDIGSSASVGVSAIKSNVAQTISMTKSCRDAHEQCTALTKLDRYSSTPEIGTHGNSDNDSSESGESIDTGDLGVNITEGFHNDKLDESCIFVDSKELPFIPYKQKSYKKKIRNAFASRMRSAKKQEYEQLAVWYGDVDNQLSCSPLSTVVKLPSHDTGESEWELL